MKRFLIVFGVVVLVLSAGCASKSKSDIVYKAGLDTTTNITTKNTATAPATTPNATPTKGATSSTTTMSTTVVTTKKPTPAASLKKGSEAFVKLLDSAKPIFSDKFESTTHAPATISSAFYKQSVPSTNKITYGTALDGNSVHLDSYDSYIGYPAGTIKGTEGAIRFSWKPDADIYKSYTEKQSVWRVYGNIEPPYVGFLVDTVGWNAAFPGGYCVSLNFLKGDSNYSNMTFGTWSGSNWSQAGGELTSTIKWDSSKWYDIVVSYSQSKGKIVVYIDSYLAAEAKYNTGLSLTEGFFLGQGPWKMGQDTYWPYGPHAMKGSYSYLRIYDQALMD
jgi:hypothetical protein